MLCQIKNTIGLKALKPNLPAHIYREAERIIGILEECYQMTGEYSGSIYILANASDLVKITQQYPYLNLADYEFLDIIESDEQMTHASLLYILDATDTLSMIMPIKQLPKVIKQEEKIRLGE